MKRFSSLALTLACSSAMLVAQPRPGFRPGGFGILGEGPGSRAVVTGAPYSAVQTSSSVQVLPGGNQITHTNQSKVYRDSQGRVRTEHTETNRNGQQQTVVTIFDPVGGNSYVLNPAAQTAVQRPLPSFGNAGPPPGRTPSARNGAQVQTTNLGTKVVNGVTATGTQTVETIPAGAIGNAQPIEITRTVWISTDLKVPVQIVTSDPRFGNSDFELTNIVLGEPDSSLFVVPSTYSVTTARGFGGGAGAGARMRRPPSSN